MRVFLDASALIPLALERDQWSRSLRRNLRALAETGAPELVTTNWTYYEALAVCRRSGMHVVNRMRRIVDAEVSPAKVSDAAETEALRRFLTWHDKTASVVDHANLLVAVELGCEAILTFDDDFLPIASSAGIRVLR